MCPRVVCVSVCLLSVSVSFPQDHELRVIRLGDSWHCEIRSGQDDGASQTATIRSQPPGGGPQPHDRSATGPSTPDRYSAERIPARASRWVTQLHDGRMATSRCESRVVHAGHVMVVRPVPRRVPVCRGPQNGWGRGRGNSLREQCGAVSSGGGRGRHCIYIFQGRKVRVLLGGP
ncbi:hypothetical protein KC19_6G179800 [Ceratodon purpureus]|uniref:Secreted protein n=1 Tax=Ceratodon purpureus TaxID=3225 RepID=A0A8T0HFY6_CERPU|nr:hypothetical protein KC19_6G179800 [Ceratodon purpureus]